jgi:hypothetical protein
MIHLVRENDGSVAIDLSYSKQGRGAYLCPDVNCWEIGIKQNRLEYGLRTKLSSQNRQALLDFSQTLIRENNFE